MNKTASLGLGDMMSALMMVFMFISIAFLAQMEQSHLTFIKELNEALHEEFDPDLERWTAEITDQNIVRFQAPFDVGSTTISVEFQSVLEEFCPRYISVLRSDKFTGGIQEVKVEGHTSHGWNRVTKAEQAFINNIELSQRRAVNVLSYCYLLQDKEIVESRNWLETYFHANGLASSRPIYDQGQVSNALSRRVEFTVVSKMN
jgi:outer membrane protein OmpA-like peptidoglycan-associated protein